MKRELGHEVLRNSGRFRSAITAIVGIPERELLKGTWRDRGGGKASPTSARFGEPKGEPTAPDTGEVGVFISVTTIPAASDTGVSLAFGNGSEARGSVLQLLLNVTVLTAAAIAGLPIPRAIWPARRPPSCPVGKSEAGGMTEAGELVTGPPATSASG
jgi:hypothetical protein